MTKVGAHLHRLREHAGLSQEQLGAGRYSKSFISKIESGQALPSIDALRWFSEQLRLNLRAVFPPDI
jgi:transcriptional regulator with XRE-family HTH domain